MAGLPVISVDTKKKELIGNFKNAGQAWGLSAEAVNTHDFPQDADGRAVPYGIYDLSHNHGTVYVGSSGDMPQFAVDAIARWWEERGRRAFPHAEHLLILADSGGSNGCRPRLWKAQRQAQLSDRLGLTVTVCHYPTGCSKWGSVGVDGGQTIELKLFGGLASSGHRGAPHRNAAQHDQPAHDITVHS